MVGLFGGRGVDGTGAGERWPGFPPGLEALGHRDGGGGVLRGIGRLAGVFWVGGSAVKRGWLAVGRGSRPWVTAAGAAVCSGRIGGG